MAVNHSNSFLTSKTNKKFKTCDKNNSLKSNTCPTCNGSYNAIEDKILSNSDANEVFFTNVHFSDFDSDASDTQDTLNSSDMQFSSSGSILNTSFNSDLIEDTALDDDFLSSVSENEFVSKNELNDESVPELDTVSLSSSVTSVANTSNVINQNCAVVLCNENARNHFDTLFFINFPSNKVLCDTWWSVCGHKDKFDPLFKICSIHFDPNDFKTVTVRRDGQLYRQTSFKNSEIVPTLYLLPHEYTKFIRKRKNSIKDNNDSEISLKSPETKKCIIQSCNKAFLKDSRSTLFFKFPLKNKVMLKKWLNKIDLPNWQPLETDRICSDHFENYFVMKYNNVYELDKYACPSIKPKNPFDINPEDFNNKKYEQNEHIFRNLEFKSLDDDVLMVNEKSKKNKEKKNNILLDLLENDSEKNKQMKLQYKVPETVTTLSNSIERANVLCSSTKCNNSNLEYIDVLNDLNNIDDLQLKLDNSTSLIKQYLESFEREIAEEIEKNKNSSNINNNLEYIYLDLFKNGNLVETQPLTNTNDSLAETSKMPELNNIKNANDCSCVNLTMFNGDDIETFLSLKKECIPKNEKVIVEDTSTGELNMSKIEVETKEHDVKNISNVTAVNNISAETFSSNLTKKWLIESIDNYSEVNPESIIFDQDLTQCYGEMLPPYCNPDCQLICFYSIPGPQRREIYNEFQMLHNVTEQNCKIAELVKLRFVKNGDTFKSCVSYQLTMNTKLLKVCQTFFLNTLGISECRLNAILKPINYSWYSNRDTALKVNVPKQAMPVTDESIFMTDFIKESSILLNKDYNLFEPESDTEDSLKNVSIDEYEKALLFMKNIPRVLSTCQMTVDMKKRYFETSICLENMYKMYSENYIQNKTPPPFTELQFKKMYNQCMKTLLKMV